MSDLISRQAAIKAIEEEWDECCSEYPATQIIYDTTEAIERLPIIQPKRGRWILDRSGAYCCSKCMEPCASYVMMKPRDKFCKMCGSRNEVDNG